MVNAELEVLVRRLSLASIQLEEDTRRSFDSFLRARFDSINKGSTGTGLYICYVLKSKTPDLFRRDLMPEN